MVKICFFCGSFHVVKDGHFFGIQRYRCRVCGKRFVNKQRLSPDALYHEYLYEKQTLKQLAVRHHVSVSSIQRCLRKTQSNPIAHAKQEVVVLMDATYWSKHFGVLVFKNACRHNGVVLWHKFLHKHETVSDYMEGVQWLEEHGFCIRGIVCDGLKGLFRSLQRYPVQYCQFHQVKVIQTKLTKHPESTAGKELLDIAYLLAHTDKESFEGALDAWRMRHKSYMDERSQPDTDGKTHYLHKRLRSAFLSLKRNAPYLWTWYEYIDLGIPNTNNGIEALFTDLKTKMRVHNGMTDGNKKRFIEAYLTEIGSVAVRVPSQQQKCSKTHHHF